MDNLPDKPRDEPQDEPDVEGELVNARLIDPVTGEQRIVQIQRTYAGPIPEASQLAAYEAIQPGFADRILRMAESSLAHRQRIERVEAEEPFRLARRGQAFALIVVVVVLVFAAFLAARGHPEIAAIVAGVDLIALVTVFLTGQRGGDEPPPQ